MQPKKIGGTEALDKLRDVFCKMSKYTEEERFRAYVDVMPETDGEKLPFEMVIRMNRIYCQSFKVAQYTPDFYFGSMRYLTAEDDCACMPRQGEEVVEFWGKVCLGEFTTYTIQGNHYSCVEPPYAENVVKWGAALFLKQEIQNN